MCSILVQQISVDNLRTPWSYRWSKVTLFCTRRRRNSQGLGMDVHTKKAGAGGLGFQFSAQMFHHGYAVRSYWSEPVG